MTPIISSVCFIEMTSEQIVHLCPVPRLARVGREDSLPGNIWFVTREQETWVSQSLPAIMRTLKDLGHDKSITCMYRAGRNGEFRCKRLTDVDELNDALVGRPEATFVVRDPACWEVQG